MQLDETQHVFPISGQQNFPNAISSSHIQISWNVIFSNFSCNFLTQFFFFLNIQFPRTDPNFPAQLFNTTFLAKIFKFHATHITSKFFIRLSNTSFEVFLQRFSNSFDQRNILIQYFFLFLQYLQIFEYNFLSIFTKRIEIQFINFQD